MQARRVMRGYHDGPPRRPTYLSGDYWPKRVSSRSTRTRHLPAQTPPRSRPGRTRIRQSPIVSTRFDRLCLSRVETQGNAIARRKRKSNHHPEGARFLIGRERGDRMAPPSLLRMESSSQPRH